MMTALRATRPRPGGTARRGATGGSTTFPERARHRTRSGDGTSFGPPFGTNRLPSTSRSPWAKGGNPRRIDWKIAETSSTRRSLLRRAWAPRAGLHAPAARRSRRLGPGAAAPEGAMSRRRRRDGEDASGGGDGVGDQPPRARCRSGTRSVRTASLIRCFHT